MIIYVYEVEPCVVQYERYLSYVRFFLRGNHVYLKLTFPFLERIGEIRLMDIQLEWRAEMSTVSHNDSSREASAADT